MFWINLFVVLIALAGARAGGDADDGERDFRILIQAGNVTVYKSEYADVADVKDVTNDDDGTTYLDGRLNIIKEINSDTSKGYVNGWETSDRANWQHTLSQSPQPICDFLKNNGGIVKDLGTHSNFYKECPLDVRDIKFDKYLVDEKSFPKDMKRVDWNLVITIETNDEKILEIFLSVRVESK